jgi:hypothetical protein
MIYKKYNKKSFKKGVTKHIIEKVLGISKGSNKNKLFLRVSWDFPVKYPYFPRSNIRRLF